MSNLSIQGLHHSIIDDLDYYCGSGQWSIGQDGTLWLLDKHIDIATTIVQMDRYRRAYIVNAMEKEQVPHQVKPYSSKHIAPAIGLFYVVTTEDVNRDMLRTILNAYNLTPYTKGRTTKHAVYEIRPLFPIIKQHKQ